MTKPARRDILRPAELIGISAILALFVGLTVLLTTRAWLLAGVFTGIAFIVVLVGIAMLLLSFKPNKNELTEMDQMDDESGPPSTH